MRHAPLLVVLDEPTASLDALSEAALFDRYTAAARDLAAAQGTITLLVSHRFSTVRAADLIVVLEHGNVRCPSTAPPRSCSPRAAPTPSCSTCKRAHIGDPAPMRGGDAGVG